MNLKELCCNTNKWCTSLLAIRAALAAALVCTGAQSFVPTAPLGGRLHLFRRSNALSSRSPRFMPTAVVSHLWIFLKERCGPYRAGCAGGDGGHDGWDGEQCSGAEMRRLEAPCGWAQPNPAFVINCVAIGQAGAGRRVASFRQPPGRLPRCRSDPVGHSFRWDAMRPASQAACGRHGAD
jgi:hypothetical protein